MLISSIIVFMALPFFYKEDITSSSTKIALDEATSKHIVQVLRMQNGEQLQLTNGKGDLFTCEIIEDNRKKCTVLQIENSKSANPKLEIAIAISPLKNNTRFEWFLEKAAEMGVTAIIPLICNRTEKIASKQERMKTILVSAMLQSQQCILPKLQEPISFEKLIKTNFDSTSKFIAHCIDEEAKAMLYQKINTTTNQLILIGPEGDFTPKEIEQALQNNYLPVSLGITRLRTETAALVAATILTQLTSK